MLKVRNLRTHFFTEAGLIKAVDGIDLSIGQGQTLGLVGESGCGKSVTALSIMRLVQPPGRIVSGQIHFGRDNLVALTPQEMRRIRGNRISMIFQEPMTSLNPVFRVGDQICEAIKLHQDISRREAMKMSVAMLTKVGIPEPKQRAREYPHQMSGGMRQRVMIAMALSCNPALMIADEPTTALDVTIQAQIMRLMNELKEDFNASILLITHDLGVIADMAQSVAVMYAGKIVEYADVIPLFKTPRHPYTIGLMDSIPKMNKPIPINRKLKTIPGVVPSLLGLPAGCSFQDRCERAFEPCRRESPSLIELEAGHVVRCWLYAVT